MSLMANGAISPKRTPSRWLRQVCLASLEASFMRLCSGDAIVQKKLGSFVEVF